ncbi:MAG: hypothetical protein IGS48_20695 [Oscillatoriales cyanobacterium C42_A2020_001]|nr:hypothetical protein [Leptolyngbyaceae cyanobacterium C42_A2020_001]
MCNYFALTSPTLLSQNWARRELKPFLAPNVGRRAGDEGKGSIEGNFKKVAHRVCSGIALSQLDVVWQDNSTE